MMQTFPASYIGYNLLHTIFPLSNAFNIVDNLFLLSLHSYFLSNSQATPSSSSLFAPYSLPNIYLGVPMDHS